MVPHGSALCLLFSAVPFFFLLALKLPSPLSIYLPFLSKSLFSFLLQFFSSPFKILFSVSLGHCMSSSVTSNSVFDFLPALFHSLSKSFPSKSLSHPHSRFLSLFLPISFLVRLSFTLSFSRFRSFAISLESSLSNPLFPSFILTLFSPQRSFFLPLPYDHSISLRIVFRYVSFSHTLFLSPSHSLSLSPAIFPSLALSIVLSISSVLSSS